MKNGKRKMSLSERLQRYQRRRIDLTWDINFFFLSFWSYPCFSSIYIFFGRIRRSGQPYLQLSGSTIRSWCIRGLHDIIRDKKRPALTQASVRKNHKKPFLLWERLFLLSFFFPPAYIQHRLSLQTLNIILSFYRYRQLMAIDGEQKHLPSNNIKVLIR